MAVSKWLQERRGSAQGYKNRTAAMMEHHFPSPRVQLTPSPEEANQLVGNIGIMKKKMETLGPFQGMYRVM